jgi:DNA polymerase
VSDDFGSGGGVHPRALARQFAAALAHVRDTWDVQYWPAGVLPLAGPAASAPAQASAPAPSPDVAPDVPRDNVAQPAALREQARAWSPATKLEYLRRRNVGDCQRCGLAKTRTHIVFGVGNPEAKIVFVGEAPGADEDRQGEPFVGRAGKRLDQWLGEVGLARADVYIANVLKCRPPGNRDPKPEEVDRCSPFLQAQIRAISPRVIVALGRHAGMLLSRREDLSLGKMRSSRLHYEIANADGSAPLRIPLVVTYHPAYVLRQEDGGEAGRGSAEETALGDLRRALQIVAGEA